VATVRVVATLRRFLREGTPWLSLKATADMACGSTLRPLSNAGRARACWGRCPPPLVAMLRGEPTLILDTCSMRAKRAGDRTGPNPTDRGKRGIKDHIAVKADGIVLRLHREVAEATRRCGTVALVYGNGRVAARGLPGGMRGA
jgi:hypothetical protein